MIESLYQKKTYVETDNNYEDGGLARTEIYVILVSSMAEICDTLRRSRWRWRRRRRISQDFVSFERCGLHFTTHGIGCHEPGIALSFEGTPSS